MVFCVHKPILKWNEKNGKRKKLIDGRFYSLLLSLTYRYGNFFINYQELNDNQLPTFLTG